MRSVFNTIRGLAIMVCFLAMVLWAMPGAAYQSSEKTQSTPGASEKKNFRVLFTNVYVFDGINEKRLENADVLIEGNLVKEISTEKIDAKNATVIDGGGRTLMPGLIDNHWYVMFAGASLAQVVGRDDFNIGLLAARQAEATLMRGFTTN